jgi:hypothetical protein
VCVYVYIWDWIWMYVCEHLCLCCAIEKKNGALTSNLPLCTLRCHHIVPWPLRLRAPKPRIAVGVASSCQPLAPTETNEGPSLSWDGELSSRGGHRSSVWALLGWVIFHSEDLFFKNNLASLGHTCEDTMVLWRAPLSAKLRWTSSIFRRTCGVYSCYI